MITVYVKGCFGFIGTSPVISEEQISYIGEALDFFQEEVIYNEVI